MPPARQYDPVTTVGVCHIPQVEKEPDDPSEAASTSRPTSSSTLTTLTRLFAVQADVSPDQSRQSSYLAPARRPSSYARAVRSPAALSDHLYKQGFLDGRHSDIAVIAFGQRYRLHRLILDRAPFFSSALSEPWLEASATQMTIHPEDIDSSITQAAFELAIKRLYGLVNVAEEDRHAVGLFATGCWLEMQDLIDASVVSILRQMTLDSISNLIKIVTSSYYGRAGDKILASAKSILCRDGWKMPLRFWKGIPGDIVREIVGGDGFFIDGEWDRWVLAKRILDARLKAKAIAAGLTAPGSKRRIQKAPDTANLMAVRFDTIYRRSSASTGRGVPASLQKWIIPYTDPDVEPLLVLLDEGIHYVHLDFEQLQHIRSSTDVLGLPVIPEKVISNALWQSMELRQKITNAREVDLELGLSIRSNGDLAMDLNRDTTMSIGSSSGSSIAKGKRRAAEAEEADECIDSGSWDGNGKPRKFFIPTCDCNIVMGGNVDPIVATSSSSSIAQRHASRLSATIQPEDVQWASDFAAASAQPRPPTAVGDNDPEGSNEPDSINYTNFPPFRFAAEFPNPRLLKEKKRVYSRTVFYAGSLWKLYIQKVASSRSRQLGVYLHRAKERETEEVVAGTGGLAQGSVDERIGQLERAMILRSEIGDSRQRRRTTVGSEGPEGNGTESSGSAGFEDGPLIGVHAQGMSQARANTMRHFLSRGHKKTSQADVANPELADEYSNGPIGDGTAATLSNPLSEDSDDENDDDDPREASNKFHVPTLPPYVDTRPTIKTYFKIYSPSRGGRVISVYESAPDRFNFSQSWGWKISTKSSTLMLDEGLLGDDLEDTKDDHDGTSADRDGSTGTLKNHGDGKLRFMVVIGNI
ncbi:hypothetical protein DOTSEDRAFT_119569 [Dothistroma septosporum NZE10]|uniref:BTB domain-containing protein n=1 Tax=Dothistroma septosporum (strain NZE10 / CBS 128990) TaxID=675120 RepID=N1Q0I0_DOTSN|nr:hypothetical protein DOTSEDRAFT_119569 [Dothistroma septosporum NZE10]